MAPSPRWLATLAVSTAAATLSLALALAAATPSAAGAQQIHGTVHDSVSGLPVPGAVVSVLDSTGSARVRAITGQDGQFSLARPDRAAALRVIRIGYTPRQLPLAPAGAPPGPLPIAMLQLPAMLTQVRASGQAVCGATPDRGDALALWEQARAGLLATVVARETRPGEMRVLSYVTDLDPDTHLVLHQTTADRSGTTGRPFVASAPAAEFARHGFMTPGADALTFFAPDADVLLDDAFAATHCFRVAVDDRGHPGQVGLAFAPAHARDGFVDVAGTLWIDRAAPRLLALNYTYTGLDPWYEDAGAGGTLAFRTMPTGLAFIERWAMHLPAFTTESPGLRTSARTLGRAGRWSSDAPGEPPGVVRLTGLRDIGADVLLAEWPDGTRVDEPMGAVAGTVTEPDGRTPLGGVAVHLAGTSRTAVSDSTGRFLIGTVLPGRYQLSALDTLVAPFTGESPASRSPIVDVGRDTAHAASVQMPSRARALARACRAPVPGPLDRTTVILGRLTDPQGRSLDGLTVQADWGAPNARAPADDHASHLQGITPGSDGRFLICRIPRLDSLLLSVWRGPDRLADTTLRVPDAPSVAVTWALHPRANVPRLRPAIRPSYRPTTSSSTGSSPRHTFPATICSPASLGCSPSPCTSAACPATPSSRNGSSVSPFRSASSGYVSWNARV